jgi:hypothetical protein
MMSDLQNIGFQIRFQVFSQHGSFRIFLGIARKLSAEEVIPNFATGGQGPSTMPQQNAAVIATAGNFTGRASSAPAFRCGRSVETDRTDGLPRFRNEFHPIYRRQNPPPSRSRSALPNREPASKDRTRDT